ncbi:hypothetical protein [Nocardioides sp. cx-173]|uniref:hypothetical protein n=1 Tax=Nocardioides sp. cx-173 TaxID=2898796 RepID=UPI001E31C614|nr:hypothetical protein [Nocardioides sp. cx-173]MCD4524655.1 hypothetical protein [Nocardioides sp. cx-173]UGB42865.1 hypothetical protein LQ940_04900 [Nocardioides sp. cx-173]
MTALAVVLMLAAGCSDDEPSAAPDPSPTVSGSESGAVSPSPTPPSPSVEPAAGPELRVKRFSVRAPEGWEISPEGDPYTAQAFATGGIDTLFIGEYPDLAQGTMSVEDSARARMRSAVYRQQPKLQPYVTVGGDKWYHIAGQIDAASYLLDYGTVKDGLSLSVVLTFTLDVPAEERERIAQAVLATVTVD